MTDGYAERFRRWRQVWHPAVAAVEALQPGEVPLPRSIPGARPQGPGSIVNGRPVCPTCGRPRPGPGYYRD